MYASSSKLSQRAAPRLTAAAVDGKQKLKRAVIFGCGLSASGALAIPKLVVKNQSPGSDVPATTPKSSKSPKRITFFNTHDIRHVSSGFGFSVFASKNRIFGAGLNNRFQVGGRVHDVHMNKGQSFYISSKKISIPIDENVVAISSGRAHSLVATKNKVFAFGDNCFGQCGRNPELSQIVVGTDEAHLEPVPIDVEGEIAAVHCSLDTSFVLTSKGELLAFGLNEDGQCANEEYGIQWKPTKIKGDASDVKIRSLSASTDTILAVSSEGDTFLWGQNEYSQSCKENFDIQLNISRRITPCTSKITSIGSTATSCLALTENGEVFVWGVGVLGLGPNIQRLPQPVKLDQPLFDNSKVVKVFAGNTNMAALNEDGRVFVWGENRFGSLGLGHEKAQLFPFQLFLPGDVKKVSLGPDHSLFLIR